MEVRLNKEPAESEGPGRSQEEGARGRSLECTELAESWAPRRSPEVGARGWSKACGEVGVGRWSSRETGRRVSEQAAGGLG